MCSERAASGRLSSQDAGGQHDAPDVLQGRPLVLQNVQAEVTLVSMLGWQQDWGTPGAFYGRSAGDSGPTALWVISFREGGSLSSDILMVVSLVCYPLAPPHGSHGVPGLGSYGGGRWIVILRAHSRQH